MFCLASLPPQSNRDFELQLEATMRDLDEMRDSLKCDLFFLHCDLDLPSPDQTEVADPRVIKQKLEERGYKWFELFDNNLVDT